MAFTKTAKPRRSGLDDGAVKTKKQKKQEQQQLKAASEGDTTTESKDTTKTPTAKKDVPTPADTLRIQPGESLFAFRARVDAALPLSGITKSTKKIPGAPDHRVTKHERKLKRLQKGWREEEARILDKEAEARELAEEDADEDNTLWEDRNAELSSVKARKSKGRKVKRKLVAGEVDNHSEDEFEALKKKREGGGRKGLHDVVSAPPVFTKVPREIFKVRDGAGARVGDVPKEAGSLRRREELGEERKAVVERYREVMAKRREKTEEKDEV